MALASKSPIRYIPFEPHAITMTAAAGAAEVVGKRRGMRDPEPILLLAAGYGVKLRPKERRLLQLLSNSPNRIVTSAALITALYGNVSPQSGKTRLKRLVADIRSRFGVELAGRLVTVHGAGLVLMVEHLGTPGA